MSTRTVKEGMVGLLILLGLGTFGGIFLWLNRISTGGSSYKAVVEFTNAGGMQKGAPVRYRGVKVGSIARVTTGSNVVEVEIEINNPKLKIPADSVVEANQSGLISESIIDIVPPTNSEIPPDIVGALDKDCNPGLIICHQSSRLKGKIGISVDELIRESYSFAAQYNNQEFYENVNRLLVTSADAANSVAQMTKELQSLSKSFNNQLGTFANTAVTLQDSTKRLTATTEKTASQFSVTASQFGQTARDFSVTARQAGQTAQQASKLMNNLDELLVNNSSSLVTALNNMTEISNELRQTVSSLSPAVDRFTDGKLIKNLELLSANAAEASANFKDASGNLNNPKNIVLLQQTLDAARGTFENTQKITADLDELTGDPKFRQNVLQLVNGLSKLLSSTKDVQEKTKVAITLDSLKNSVNQQQAIIEKTANLQSNLKAKNIIPQPPALTLKPEVKAIDKPKKVEVEKPEISTPPLTSESLAPAVISKPSSQELLLQKLRKHKQEVTGDE